ncbi:AfsR/SARP family transcriptional regulator [Micromonospora chersina]
MSAAFVLTMLVVPPWLLTALAGPPLPGWPTSAQLRGWIADPLNHHTLTAGLTALAWLAWLGLACTVAATAARRARARARWLRRLPLPTPWQAAATTVAGAAALNTAHIPTVDTPIPPISASTGTLHPHDGAVDTQAGDGVTVPGGWLPDTAAQQVAAAAAVVWLRRRRAYQPGQPSPEDSDLAPLPTTVTAVRAALTDADTQQPPATPATAALPALPTSCLALTGDGAADAARGILLTRLLAAMRDPQDTTRLLITHTALTTLLPDISTDTETPGLRVVETVDQAAALLSSLINAPPAPGGGAGPADLLLLTDPPNAPTTAQLATLQHAGATVVMLGAGPPGTSWSIDRHGHTREEHTGRAGPRLCVLNRTSATDLLAVIAHPARERQYSVTEPTPLRRPAETGHARIPRQAGSDRWAAAPDIPAVTNPRLHVRVLGRPALLAGGEPVTIRRSAALQVLVFLAVHPEGATTTDLVQAIWPGLPAHTVTGRLYTTLSDLRAAIRTATGATVLGHADDRYHLNPDRVDVDLWRLHAAAHHAATALTDPAPAWQTVIDTYTGDLAAGHNWAWIDPPREATRRLVLDAYASAAAAQTDPHHRLRLLQDAIRVDPYNQTLHQLAADQLNALGDADTAARLLDGYQRRLQLAGIAASDQPAPTSR